MMFANTRPCVGDSDTTLLGKIAQAIASGSVVTSVNGMTGAVTVPVPVQSVNGMTGAVTVPVPVQSVNGMTGNVVIDVPVNFRDSVTDADAIVLHTGGTVESFRVVGATGNVQFDCAALAVDRRIFLSNAQSALAVMSADSKARGAYFEIAGENYAGAKGCATVTTLNQSAGEGVFRVLNAPADSLVSVTRIEMAWNGDTRIAPFWDAGGTTFTGLKVDIDDDNSASGSKALDLHRNTASVFSINNYGNVVQAQSVLTYNASTAIDFNLGGQRTISLTGDVQFTTTNVAAGKEVTLKILADGSDRNFTFPAWIFVGTEPALIAAGKTAMLSLRCYGAADANIVAAYAVEA
jgi:hypothetical protein